jgi:2-oxo-4-hydroxy-4-carboxy-5-ureidoimidazoline decarboxylase
MTLTEMNTGNTDAIGQTLLACCGSARWASAMVAARPFADVDELFQEADRVWWSLDASDWLEAFARHPKIGERNNLSAWSTEEQRGISDASAATNQSLREKNIRYQEKFGWIFLICATGKSGAEMLAALDERLAAESESELRTAAGEQAKITRLRLQKLLAA